MSVTEICNYLAISDRIGTAGQPGRGQFAAIREAGYEVVVNLAMPDSANALADEAELVAEHGMEYAHLPVVWEEPTPADLKQFFAVMAQNDGRRVFVHCALNMRVSVFVLLYRVIQQGKSLTRAKEDMLRIWTPDETWQQFMDRALAEHGLRPEALMNPKEIVARGYDCIAEEHAAWAAQTRTEERARYTALLLDRLPAGAEVLELGCGVGLPTTRQLAGRFRVTGVDISARHVALARENVPRARFVQADMSQLHLEPDSCDAVAAFYSLIHLPREELSGMLDKVASWLRPGGLLVATMGAQAIEAYYAEDWLGAPMYWSSHDSETNRRMTQEAGLSLLSAPLETAPEFGEPVTFLWVVAQKPGDPGAAAKVWEP